MEVIPEVSILADRLRAEFPFRYKPPFGITDAIGETSAGGFPVPYADGKVYSGNDTLVTSNDGLIQGGIEYDPLLRVIYPRCVMYYHDNLIGGYGSQYAQSALNGPTVLWSNPASGPGDPTLLTSVSRSPGFLAMRAEWDAPSQFQMNGVPMTQGAPGPNPCCAFTAYVQPEFDPQGGAGQAASIRWRVVGSGRSDVRWYSVSWQTGVGVRLGYNDNIGPNRVPGPNDGGWVLAADPKLGDGLDALLTPYEPPAAPAPPADPGSTPPAATVTIGAPKPFYLQVRVLAGQMRLQYGSEDTPALWPVPETNFDGNEHNHYIDAFQVAGEGVTALEWSVHPNFFQAGVQNADGGYSPPTFLSQEINLGYVPDNWQLGSGCHFCVHAMPCPQDSKGDGVAWRNRTRSGDDPTRNGSSSTAEPGVSVVGWVPDYCAVNCYIASTNDPRSDITGQVSTTIRYALEFYPGPTAVFQKGVASLATFPVCVRAVSLHLLPEDYTAPSHLVRLGDRGAPPAPKSLQVRHTFDQANLSVRSECSLTFENFDGSCTNSEGTGWLDGGGLFPGNFAVQVNVGLAGSGKGLYTAFVGVAGRNKSNQWGGAGKDTVTVTAEDLSCTLRVPCFNLPFVDGWNVRYLIKYLAGIGGLSPHNMEDDLSNAVPDNADAYDPSVHLPYYDTTDYFMPIASAGAPVTHYGQGVMLWDVMTKIATSIGFALYFGITGAGESQGAGVPVLRFKKFSIYGGVDRVFSHQPDTANGGLNEIQAGGSYTWGNDQSRNTVTVIGVDALGPSWRPVVAHSVNYGSIWDDTREDYQGYYNPVIWADSLFVNPGYAQLAADKMLAFLSQPDRHVSLPLWLQGDLPMFPGTTLQVFYPRSGVSQHDFRFFVTVSEMTIDKGQPATINVQAALAPPP